MPYKSVPKHLHGLNLAQANKWGEVFDALKQAGADDEKAARVAWSVVKRKMKKSVVPLRKDTHAGMSLAPSKSNPAVRRWQAMDRGHSAQGHLFLTSVHLGGKLPITAAQAEKPHVKRLLAEKMIRLERNPSHHWHEYTAHITKAGREYHEAYRAAHEQTGHQESLFKGVVCIYIVRTNPLRKAPLEKAVIPALDMTPEDLEGEALPATWTEGAYSCTWKRGKKGHGSVTLEGGGLPMPFVMVAAGRRHAAEVAREAAQTLRKGKIPYLDGVFKVTRKVV